MRRYWLEAEVTEEGTILIEGESFHHICEVCRQGEGHRFEILTKGQKAYLVEIVRREKKQAMARVLEERQVVPIKKPYIRLMVSQPRFQKMDEIVEKSVELGVFSLTPVLSDFSYVRSLSKISKSKQQRWQKIVQQATQQSGRGELMEVRPPQSLREILELFNRQPKVEGLFPYEGEGTLNLKRAVKSIKTKEFDEIWVFIGSEGGFSSSEVNQFKAVGLEPVTLGPQILRVETACLAVVSILKYELDI